MYRILIFLSLCWLCLSAQAQGAYDIVVAADGSGNFKTIQAAVMSVRDYTPVPKRILIKNGVYREKLVIPSWKCSITLVGEDVEKTIITWADHANIDSMGTFRTHTVLVQGNDITLENLTIENNAPQLGQAVALHVEGDRFVARKCRILGNQDTVFTGNDMSRQWYDRCYIEGTTDFIFGPATAWFDQCIIHAKRNSYLTAASTPANHDIGYVFNRCKLTAETAANSVYLGRPWRAYASVVFMFCELGGHIRPEGWENWRNPENEKTARYAEYKNTGPGANRSKRVLWSKELSDAEGSKITQEAALRGWRP